MNFQQKGSDRKTTTVPELFKKTAKGLLQWVVSAGITLFLAVLLLDLKYDQIECTTQNGWADCIIATIILGTILMVVYGAALTIMAVPLAPILMIWKFGPTLYRWIYPNSANHCIQYTIRQGKNLRCNNPYTPGSYYCEEHGEAERDKHNRNR